MFITGNSGFPKSLDVSKAIDKAAGAEREVAGLGVQRAIGGKSGNSANHGNGGIQYNPVTITAPATEAARQWAGWGTALKPALEPITVARKPLVGTVAANVLAHGTGALNIDGCRVEGESTRRTNTAEMGYHGGNLASEYQTGSDAGRWPANLIHDGSDEVLHAFPQASGQQGHARTDGEAQGNNTYGALNHVTLRPEPRGDTGSAARFFYCSKASRSDRGAENNHPTVKPTDLMRYLCRLVTPPGGVVLDPFMGSGSTGKAAVLEGFQFIGCELSPEYLAIAEARVLAAIPM